MAHRLVRPFTRSARHRAAATLGAGALMLGLSTPMAVAQTASTTPRGPTAAVRIQLHGVGFDDGTGFEPEFHGTLGQYGRVEGGLKGVPGAQIEILGATDRAIRARARGKFVLRTAVGTIEGTNVADMAVPVRFTPAGPLPNPSAFTDVETEQFTVTAGTGRFRNATGTITMRGIIAEIPAVGGKRRFTIELSGDGTLQLDPSAG